MARGSSEPESGPGKWQADLVPRAIGKAMPTPREISKALRTAWSNLPMASRQRMVGTLLSKCTTRQNEAQSRSSMCTTWGSSRDESGSSVCLTAFSVNAEAKEAQYSGSPIGEPSRSKLRRSRLTPCSSTAPSSPIRIFGIGSGVPSKKVTSSVLPTLSSSPSSGPIR